MKTSVFILAVVLITTIATGQNQELTHIEVTAPNFNGEVPVSISNYLQKRIYYPTAESNTGRQGTVVVEFLVTPEGKLTNYEIINSVSNEIDNEVIRVLKSTEGMWIPGIINGETVAMQKEVSVVFKRNPQMDFNQIANKHLQKGNQALFVKEQPEKALKHFNRGINLLPNNETLLAVRGLCKYMLGDETGANRDWDRSKTLAKRNGTIAEIEYLAKIPANSQEFLEMYRTLNE